MNKIEKICPKCGKNYINICIQCSPELAAIGTNIFINKTGKRLKVESNKIINCDYKRKLIK